MTADVTRELAALQEAFRALARLRDEGAARSLAEVVVRRYERLRSPETAAQRRALFHLLATSFGPDTGALDAAIANWTNDRSPDAASTLWRAAEAPRLELLRAINLADDGIHTLLRMRGDLLDLRDPELAPVEQDLAYLLASWFNRGFLDLRSIDWTTPAITLEKLIEYEAVHEIRGWDDLRRRLQSDRRCYGFFHPSLPAEPLIFVEIALVDGLATNIADVIDAPTPNPTQADPPDTAIFYSITNSQPGLRGIPLGDFLLKQVIDELRRTVPSLTRFSTLSPVPGLRAWAESNVTTLGEIDQTDAPIRALAAQYLLTAKRDAEPLDPVARFHLRNGARLEQINLDGDRSAKGQRESYGVLVNYLYEPAALADNHEAYVNEGRLAHSTEIAALIND